MKITKRSLFVLVPLLAVVGTAGVLQFRKSPANTRTAQVQEQSIPQAAPETTNLVQTAAEAPAPSPPAPSPAPVIPPAPAPAPVYGEDPNNPGVFVVFDKETVMNQAGIAAPDRQYATNIAQGWYYKGPSSVTDLCGGVKPRSKMATAGADYDTNPVTQLKYCDSYVKARYGTWENGYSVFLKHLF